MTHRVVQAIESPESLAEESLEATCSLTGLAPFLREHDLEQSLSLSPESEPCDILHIHGLYTREHRDLALRAAKSGTPFVVTSHGAHDNAFLSRKSWFTRRRRRSSFRTIFARAGHVLGVNSHDRQQIEALGAGGRVETLPYGLDFAAYDDVFDRRQARDSDDRREILLLAPVHPLEGYVLFFKAFAEIAAEFPQWHVRVGGVAVGDWRKMIEAAIRRKGGQDRVTFEPASTIDARKDALTSTDLLVSPAIVSRCATPLLQALAAGVPTLATTPVAPPGLDSVMRICHPSRVELREVLRSMLGASDDERGELARRVRAQARDALDWSVLAPRWVQMYESLA